MRIEYNMEANTFCIYRNDKEVDLVDKTLLALKPQLSEFLFEEYLSHLGWGDPPLRCQFLSFNVSGHHLVRYGSYGMCEGEPARLKLRGGRKSEDVELIYDSFTSGEFPDKDFLEGFREEEIPAKTDR